MTPIKWQSAVRQFGAFTGLSPRLGSHEQPTRNNTAMPTSAIVVSGESIPLGTVRIDLATGRYLDVGATPSVS